MSEFEHGQLSPWGYSFDAETLPDFITSQDFSTYTNGKFGTTDTRIAANITSVSASIRNYCGLHVSPSLECGMLYNVRELRDSFVGSDLLIQLPATYVTNVTKVVLDAVWNDDADDWDGEIITDPQAFDWGMGNGLVRVYDVGARDRRSKIFIRYTAGFPNTAISVIKEITASRVACAVVNPYGVSSESAGGVSVSYSTALTGRSNSTTLPDDTLDNLNMYKVKGVF